MKLHQKVLRFLDPKGEERRQDLRLCMARTCAEAEDLDKTIILNGFDFKRLQEPEKSGHGRGS